MYSSWYKNDLEPSEDDHVFLNQKPSNNGTIWFVSLAIVSFLLVGLAIFIPTPGLIIAFVGFLIAPVVFTIWLLFLIGF